MVCSSVELSFSFRLFAAANDEKNLNLFRSVNSNEFDLVVRNVQKK